MKLHRFFVADQELSRDFWVEEKGLFHQWTRVLRYEIGREVILFNSNRDEHLYRIRKISDKAVHVELITEIAPKVPKNNVYLCFSLLKKDKNEWVLQKGTELGISHFMPLLTDRTEKTGWDNERAEKIVIEAAEQCDRSDIPRLREPMRLETAINELHGKAEVFIAEQGSPEISNSNRSTAQPVAVLIGPEGGWTDEEKQLFKDRGIKHLALSEFTLRAETAAIAAAALLQ